MQLWTVPIEEEPQSEASEFYLGLASNLLRKSVLQDEMGFTGMLKIIREMFSYIKTIAPDARVQVPPGAKLLIETSTSFEQLLSPMSFNDDPIWLRLPIKTS